MNSLFSSVFTVAEQKSREEYESYLLKGYIASLSSDGGWSEKSPGY